MSDKTILFSHHARAKFAILRNHGLDISEEKVAAVASNPDAVYQSYSGRKIAQGALDERRVLRIIFEESNDKIMIVTFYPGKKERYEKS